MAKIKCLECPHEIFYSAKGGEIRCVKCKSTYEWDGEELTLLLSGKVIAENEAKVQDLGVNKEAEEERKRLEQLIRRKAQLTGENVEMKLAEAGFGASAYGGKATAMGGNAELRYQDNEVDEGLKIKGKKVANWVV